VKDVDASELVEAPLDEGDDGVLARYVDAGADGAPAAFDDRSRDDRGVRGIDVGDQHVGAFICESLRARATDAAPRTDNDGRLTGEPFGAVHTVTPSCTR